MRKKGLERYLIISSIASILIVVVSFMSATFYNPVIKQSLQYGDVSDLIEQYSLGLIELDDLFDGFLD
ncbi:MAG: hypothetical protein II005_02045 [Turicibacter sp.]|nr:hypothetical protein [Turicibacter sp.]